MKAFTYIWFLAAALLAQAQPDESPIEGYTIEEFSWEQVLSQLRDINPNYDAEFAIPADEVEHPVEEEATSSHLTKRGDVKCGGYPKARRVHIEQGIKYLRGVPGKPQRGPGPGSCGQVSCSWSSAIWWCNDNTFTKVLPSFNNIADGAQLIKNTCLHGGQMFSGQDSHNDKWSTIVRWHKC
ncbi:hypothetical protein AARAC_007459 [Aspergillus arachidicola]|uniref:Secreted protein n=1 Tax=Aspergillus arachidicola TaxID=656916 RepID=A0A2G7G3L4_9EURO|nr:hypothetical protein AARAC_007459 [Aspergillus arachidicola]